MPRESNERKKEKENEGIKRMQEYYDGVLEKSKEIIEALKIPLPSTFRVTPGIWREEIEKELAGNNLVKKIEWERGVYKIELSKKDLSQRNIKENIYNLNIEELQKISGFLKTYASSSLVTRQEAVSMLPVIALEVEEDSVVVDTCASPGSKSSQILEVLGEKGVLICNDANRRRIDRLVKQTKRFGHPGLIVTCSDASIFPSIGVVPDRVLCDVPCSGDGTVRKNRHIFQKWQIKESVSLFSLQRRILKRGIDMLKPNGILVYSTCSLNPIENEIVILSVLEEREDIDIVPFEIPGLIMHQGLGQEQIRRSIERAKNMRNYKYDERIKNCRRVHPNDQDTGGFFIAKIRKREIPKLRSITQKQINSTDEDIKTNVETNLLIRGEENKDSSIYYLSPEIKKEIDSQWGAEKQVLVAKTLRFRQAYNVSEKAMKIVESASPALNIIFAGVRTFSLFANSLKNTSQSNRWRITYEGLKYFIPQKDSKVIHISNAQLLSILETGKDEDTQKRVSKNICVLQAPGPKKNSLVHVPFILANDKIEVLVDKIEKNTLIDVLCLFRKHNLDRFNAEKKII